MLKFEMMNVLPYVMFSLFFFGFRLFYFFVELTPHIFLHVEIDCGLYNKKIGRSAPGSITRLRALGNIELHLRSDYDIHSTSIRIYTYFTVVCVWYTDWSFCDNSPKKLFTMTTEHSTRDLAVWFIIRCWQPSIVDVWTKYMEFELLA